MYVCDEGVEREKMLEVRKTESFNFKIDKRFTKCMIQLSSGRFLEKNQTCLKECLMISRLMPPTGRWPNSIR